MGILLIIGGTVNTFLLKPRINMKEDFGVWKNIAIVKFVLTVLFLTPIA